MGQRLTVDILENGKRVALIYYHWSAYFEPTIYELKLLCDDITKTKAEEKDILLGIIEGLEKRGGGLSIEARTRAVAKEKWPDKIFTMDVDRSDGLLDLDEDDMNDTFQYTEGTASIDIDAEEVIDDVDLEMNYKITDLPFNPFKEAMTFEQLDILFKFLNRKYQKG